MDRAKLTSGIVLALTACSTAGVHGGGSTSSGSGGAVGLGGASGTTTSSTTASSSTVATGVTTGVGGAGGSGGAAPSTCNPMPDPSTLWAQKAMSYPSYQDTTLCPYVGQVLLIVNTAAV